MGTTAVCASTVLSLIGAGHGGVPDSAASWLMRMQDAVETVNYEGTLVRMSPGDAEQFRIYHRVDGGKSTERIVLVDGMGAEIIRTQDEVICIFPDQRSMVVEKRQSAVAEQGPFRGSLPAYSDALQESYQLALVAEDRIAERSSVVLAIQPKDAYRYGYRLWLDANTAMPLKTQLIDTDSTMPLEEIRFTSISMPESLPAEAVEPDIDTAAFNVVRHGRAPEPPSDAPGEIAWSATDLPPGFMLTASRLEFLEGATEPRMHLVYSDGLASVSVFMDMGVAASERGEGPSSMGATNAYSIMKSKWLVTAVGEVPASTVQRIAVSVSESP